MVVGVVGEAEAVGGVAARALGGVVAAQQALLALARQAGLTVPGHGHPQPAAR
jgi:hypothetical protein